MYSITNKITFLGILAIFLYCLTKILSFFGINQSIYGPYLLFFIIMMISTLILPNKYPTI
jgi:hypothetical protein